MIFADFLTTNWWQSPEEHHVRIDQRSLNFGILTGAENPHDVFSNTDFGRSGPWSGTQLVAATLYGRHISPCTVYGPRQRQTHWSWLGCARALFLSNLQLKACRKWTRRVLIGWVDGGMDGWMSVVVVVPLALETVPSKIAFREMFDFSRILSLF